MGTDWCCGSNYCCGCDRLAVLACETFDKRPSAAHSFLFGRPDSGKSNAVLPFPNLSKDEENAFFTVGVQDEILTDLAKIADMKVISHTSVMQYKNASTRNLSETAEA